ncbi:MAG TPA: hypothetical protein VL307_17725 [Chitinophagaceae bacterium]|nr:hypothetical protein [Chitinophagaceae bacterium]
MKTRLYFFWLMPLVVFIFCWGSCLKKSDPGPAANVYPKSVSFTYKITGISTNRADVLSYKTASGADSTVAGAALPYSVLFNRVVNKNDVLSVGYGTHSNQSVKLEIFVDNKLVKSEQFNATAGAIVYLFE